MLQQLLNPVTLKHIGTVHPALCEAAHNLAAAVHEEQAAAGRSGGSAAADKRAAGSSSGGSYFLDDMSDEEMEEEEQQQQQAGTSRMPRHGFSITPEQVPHKIKKITIITIGSSTLFKNLVLDLEIFN